MVRTKLNIILLTFLLGAAIAGPYVFSPDMPDRTIYTFVWANPVVPLAVEIEKGLFNEENEGKNWWASYEDLNEAFRKHLEEQMKQDEGVNTKEDADPGINKT